MSGLKGGPSVGGFMAEYNEVYGRAKYYDIAFRRDVTREVDFLTELYQRHAGKPLSSMIDIACGPGYHALLFASRGVRTIGLDLRPEMVEFGKELAVQKGVDVAWMAEDMRTFKLDKPVDLALTSYDSLDCLLDQDSIIAHFRAIADNLTPKGLYVFEMTNPRDCSLWEYGEFRYTGKENGVSVEIIWRPEHSNVDILNQVTDMEVEMRVNDNGREQVFKDRASERFALPQEYIALAKLSGTLNFVTFYGDFRFDQPFDNSPGSRRLIGVLQKAS